MDLHVQGARATGVGQVILGTKAAAGGRVWCGGWILGRSVYQSKVRYILGIVTA